MLLQNTKEGYFSDPIYGGNKDMGAWKMIGFPGLTTITRSGSRVTASAFPIQRSGFKGRPGWRKT